MNKKILIGSLLMLGVVVLAGCSTSNNISTTESPKVSQNEEPKKEAEKAKIEIVSHKEKKSQYGASSIIGEVINNGTAPASFISITATFYDANGQVVDTASAYAANTADVALQPGSKTPFEIMRLQDIKFDNYKLDVTWND